MRLYLDNSHVAGRECRHFRELGWVVLCAWNGRCLCEQSKQIDEVLSITNYLKKLWKEETDCKNIDPEYLLFIITLYNANDWYYMPEQIGAANSHDRNKKINFKIRVLQINDHFYVGKAFAELASISNKLCTHHRRFREPRGISCSGNSPPCSSHQFSTREKRQKIRLRRLYEYGCRWFGQTNWTLKCIYRTSKFIRHMLTTYVVPSFVIVRCREAQISFGVSGICKGWPTWINYVKPETALIR